MPEVTIKYDNPKTLEALRGLSKYFGFSISKPKAKKKEEIVINGVIMARGVNSTSTINNAEMNEIMTRSNMDAKELRSRWQRKK